MEVGDLNVRPGKASELVSDEIHTDYVSGSEILVVHMLATAGFLQRGGQCNLFWFIEVRVVVVYIFATRARLHGNVGKLSDLTASIANPPISWARLWRVLRLLT